MTQAIDTAKLKAAAEHLEWVLQQYPDNEDVQELWHALAPLVEDAKAGRVIEPVEHIPCEYDFADGRYVPLKKPNVGDAYARFATEMQGGLSERQKKRIARMDALRGSSQGGVP